MWGDVKSGVLAHVLIYKTWLMPDELVVDLVSRLADAYVVQRAETRASQLTYAVWQI